MIRVQLTARELEHYAGQPILVGKHVVDKLRAAGIPVRGVFGVIGVDAGRLVIEGDSFTFEPADLEDFS